MSKITDEVLEFLTPIVTELGYEIADIEFAKKYNGNNLTIFIDSPNGITINDCEKVHKAIDGPLDELNPTNDASYILNVSSPGVDRPLKSDRDFEKNLGQTLEVKLFKPIDGKKILIGILERFDDQKITLSVSDKKLDIERKFISKITKFIEF